MDLLESILDGPVENISETYSEPLENYLLDRPALVLTLLDVAERYANDSSPDRSVR